MTLWIETIQQCLLRHDWCYMATPEPGNEYGLGERKVGRLLSRTLSSITPCTMYYDYEQARR